MKKCFSILLSLISFSGFSQTLETKNFEWEAKPALHKLDSAEAAATAVYIEDSRVIEYIYNKDSELEEYLTRHRIIHISDSKAVDDFNKIYVGVSSPDQLIVFKARSIDKNGKIKEMLRGEMKMVDEDGSRYMSLAVDGLEKNTELEYYYTLRRNIGYFRTETIYSEYKVRKCDIKIISPENIVIDAKPYNGFPVLKDTLINRKRILSASGNNFVPFPEEEYATTDANKMRVEMKIAKNLKRNSGRLMTWADAGSEYYDRIWVHEKDETKEADKIASKLQLKKNKTDKQVIRTIENYVKTTFEITESADVGKITDIVKKNYADATGICRLTAALLKTAGIKFEILITIGRYTKKFDPDFDTWNYLDDIVFFFPSLNMYMMPNNYLYRAGQLPSGYIGVSALYIKEISIGEVASAVSSVKKIPMPEAQGNGDDLNVKIKFSPDMSKVEQKTVRTFAGYASTGTRPFYFYADDEKKKEQLENLLKSGTEDAVVTNAKAENFNLNSDEADKPFIISGDVKYSSLIEKAGTTILFNVGMVIGPQVEMYTDKKRVQPVEIEYLHSYDRTITIEIPAGYTVKELDAINMNVVSDDTNPPSMGFISSYTLKGNILEIKVREYYHMIGYPASYFEKFRKVINASADFNKIKIVLEKNK